MTPRNRIERVIGLPFLFLIWVYQRFVSVLLPSSCIYWPSCSEYARVAFIKHGVLGGLYLTIRRLLRCHPFHQGGVDEVPETLSFFNHK